jgi:hypothetical protein
MGSGVGIIGLHEHDKTKALYVKDIVCHGHACQPVVAKHPRPMPARGSMSIQCHLKITTQVLGEVLEMRVEPDDS